MSDHPNRISPWRVMTDLDETFRIADGPFTLTGSQAGELASSLDFHWRPDPRFAFEGEFANPLLEFGHKNWHLRGKIRDRMFDVPVLLTGARSRFSESSVFVRGFVSKPIELGADESFDVLRFSLVNFPDYQGASIRDPANSLLFKGRLALPLPEGGVQVDAIPEVKDLRTRLVREGGFIITNVGEFVPADGPVTSGRALQLLELLHNWFGFCRGAFTGPVFPQGLRGDEVVWEHLAPWRLSEGGRATCWLPEKHPIDLQDAFAGFVKRWESEDWREPLTIAIAWYVEANAERMSNVTRIILAQVALEMLAYVLVVETERHHARPDFDRLSAAGRIRTLLQVLDIPTSVPAHFARAQKLLDQDAFDGPGLIASVRNKFVHATAKSRATLAAVSGIHQWECGQLALQYLELALLALFGYRGRYAQRAWRGWKGDNEIHVPWRQRA